jgi:hypothetical protein
MQGEGDEDAFDRRPLKGPKYELFGSRVFTQIRPVWDLGTRPKKSKVLLVKLENRHFVFFCAVADIAKRISPMKS